MSYAGAFTDKNNTDHPITSTLYGTCATAANEAAKVVVCTDFDTLLTGVTIRVKFSNGNTAANPTININSTGAKSVFRFGSTTPVGAGSWEAGAVVELTYDGTSFFMTNSDNIAAKQNVTDNTLQTTDKTVPGAINELKCGLTNLRDNGCMSIFMNTTADGRYYSYDFSNWSFDTARVPVLVIKTDQSNVNPAIIVGYVKNDGFRFAESSGVTYNSGTKVLTVDCGSNAWTAPIILISGVAVPN